MGLKLFKVPSKCLLISWIYWFDPVRNMWGLLSTSHDPTTANDNLSNKPYICLGLLYNLTYLLRPVYAIPIILGIFDPFYFLYTSWDGIPLGKFDNFWSKQTFFNFDVFQNLLEDGRLCNSEAGASLLTGIYCTCSLDCVTVRVLLIFSGGMLGSCLGVSLEYSSRYGVNQV